MKEKKIQKILEFWNTGPKDETYQEEIKSFAINIKKIINDLSTGQG